MCPNFRQHYVEYLDRYLLSQEVEKLERLISDENLELLPDYEQRLQVWKQWVILMNSTT